MSGSIVCVCMCVGVCGDVWRAARSLRPRSAAGTGTGGPGCTQCQTGTWSVLLKFNLQWPVPYIPVALSAQYLASASPRLALQCPVHGQCQPEAGIPVPSVGPAGRPGAPLASAATT